MENEIQPNTPLAQPLSEVPVLPPKNWLKILLFISLGLIVAAGLVFIGIQTGKRQIAGKQSTVTLSPTTLPTNSGTTTNLPTDWKTAKFGELFSYEYPVGWNVAELWQENYSENGIMIAIDPNPIRTAPRGGPLATFEITVLNGNKNPDEILAKKISNFNQDNYSDITQETINTDIGKIYHYKGKSAGEMRKGEPVESYFFTFNQNANDPLNQQVVVATLAFQDDSQLLAMLKHIVLSFKKLTP